LDLEMLTMVALARYPQDCCFVLFCKHATAVAMRHLGFERDAY